VFAIASISKTFVAALILRLAEEGALSVDDRLSRFLPAFPRANRITLRQMLSHTSGIHDYFQSGRYRAEVFADRSQTWTFDEIIDFMLGPRCRPGLCYHYSNTNYVLLGRVAEIATGRPLAALLRSRFFEPLGLARTVFQPDDPTPADAAHGHLREGAGMVDFTRGFRIIPHPSATTVAWAAGNIASTPEDLTTWGAALYGGTLLEPDSLAQMLTFTAPYGGYGLGVYRFEFHDRPAVGHTGGIHGFVSILAHFPVDGVTVAVTQNRGKTSPVRVLNHVMAVLLGIRGAS
jgi:D-alanyl-D-alanine carboxypeptidase